MAVRATRAGPSPVHRAGERCFCRPDGGRAAAVRRRVGGGRPARAAPGRPRRPGPRPGRTASTTWPMTSRPRPRRRVGGGGAGVGQLAVVHAGDRLRDHAGHQLAAGQRRPAGRCSPAGRRRRTAAAAGPAPAASGRASWRPRPARRASPGIRVTPGTGRHLGDVGHRRPRSATSPSRSRIAAGGDAGAESPARGRTARSVSVELGAHGAIIGRRRASLKAGRYAGSPRIRQRHAADGQQGSAEQPAVPGRRGAAPRGRPRVVARRAAAGPPPSRPLPRRRLGRPSRRPPVTNTAGAQAERQEQADRQHRARSAGARTSRAARHRHQRARLPRSSRARTAAGTRARYAPGCPTVRATPRCAPERPGAGRWSLRRSAGAAASVRRRLLEDVGDLPADQLVTLQQRVAQRGDQVLVGLEQPADGDLLPLQQLLDPAPALGVAEDPADEVGVAEAAVVHRGVRHQRVGHAGTRRPSAPRSLVA